jgi:hypothetical protein
MCTVHKVIDHPGNLRWGLQRKIRPYRNHDISLSWERFRIEPKRLSANPFNPVSGNRPFYLSVDTDPDSAETPVIGSKNEGYTNPVQSAAFPVNRIKLLFLAQQAPFRQTIPDQSTSGGEAGTTSGATRIDDGSSRLGAHPRPESMFSFSLYIAWLKCSLTHFD